MTATLATGTNSPTARLDVGGHPADDDRLGTISTRAWRVVLAVAFAVVAVPRPAAQGLVATDLLDRYFWPILIARLRTEIRR